MFIQTATQEQLKSKPNFAHTMHADELLESRKKSCVIFEYESREWCGSVIHQLIAWKDRSDVYFINVQLPNDKFIHSEQYNMVITDDDCDGTIEGTLWDDLFHAVADMLMSFAVPSFGPVQFDPSEDLQFDFHSQTLQFRLWSAARDHCYRVKWRNGPVVTFSTKEPNDTRKKRYDDLLKNWK